MTTTREQILTAAIVAIRDGGSVSLDSAARQAGLTKAGVIHHFPTKQKLMVGLVDHVVQRCAAGLEERLGCPVEQASTAGRIRAYVDYTFTESFDGTDIVMLADPRLRDQLVKRWEERMGPLLEVSDEVPAQRRGSLTAARLLADGLWFASSMGVLLPSPQDRDRVWQQAIDLVDSA